MANLDDLVHPGGHTVENPVVTELVSGSILVDSA